MNKQIYQILGAVLIIIALILGLVQHFIYNIAGAHNWYFYGLVGIIGLIGIMAIAWTYIKK